MFQRAIFWVKRGRVTARSGWNDKTNGCAYIRICWGGETVSRFKPDIFTHSQRLAFIWSSANWVCVCVYVRYVGPSTATRPPWLGPRGEPSAAASWARSGGSHPKRTADDRRQLISSQSCHWKDTRCRLTVTQCLSVVPVLNISRVKKENTVKNSGHSEAEQKSAFVLASAKWHFIVTHAVIRDWRVYCVWSDA